MRRLSLLALVVAAQGCLVIHKNADVDVDSCTTDDQCAWDELCWYNVCEPALDRRYEVTVVRATVGSTHPDGGPWDPDQGAPDLLVSFGTSPEDSCVTPTRPDVYSATWDAYCDLVLPSHGELYFEVYDEDQDGYDYGAGWAYEAPDDMLDLARTHGAEQHLFDPTDTISLTIAVTPDF